MRKILFISSVGSHWGSEESLYTLVRSLDDQGWHPHVFTVEGPFQRKLTQSGFKNSVFSPCTLTRKELPKFFYTVLSFAWIAIRGRFSLIHTNDIHSAQFASISAKLARIPSVAHVRSPALSGWIDKPLNRRLLQLFDAMIAISDDVKKELIGIGFDQNKIVVIPNAVDLKKLKPGGSKRSAKEALGIEKCSPVIGVLGRIMPHKGQKYLLLAVPQLLEQYPNLKVLIVGDDTSFEGHTLTSLVQLTKRLNIEQSVFFLPHSSDIVKLLSILDVLVVPSLKEPFGRIIIEAMAMKVPVVASKVGGIPEIIEDGKYGMLVPPEDPDAITKAVIRLLSERGGGLYELIAENGRYRIEQRYTMEKHGEKVIWLYSELLNCSPCSGCNVGRKKAR